MLNIGRVRHPGPCIFSGPPGFSIEFLNVGGWLSRGDLALESKAHFLAVAEHRLATLPLSCVRLVVPRFGLRLVKTLLLVAMQVLVS